MNETEDCEGEGGRWGKGQGRERGEKTGERGEGVGQAVLVKKDCPGHEAMVMTSVLSCINPFDAVPCPEQLKRE